MKRLVEDANDTDTNRTIVLNGKAFPLNFVVAQPKGLFREEMVEIYVPYPDNYPKTPIREKLPRELAYLQIVIKDKNDPSGLNHSGEDLYLNRFYTASVYKDFLLPEESSALKGLGRQMLCAAIHYIHSLGYIRNTNTCILRLEAKGGVCSPDYQKITESELSAFFEKYPASMKYVDRYLRSDETMEKLIAMQKTMCEAMDNLKLVEYYKNTYGFLEYDIRDAASVLMSATLNSVLKKCEDVSNFQTIEPTIKRIEQGCNQCKWREPRLKTGYCSRNCAKIHQVLGIK
jgi:hypothetical protein